MHQLMHLLHSARLPRMRDQDRFCRILQTLTSKAPAQEGSSVGRLPKKLGKCQSFRGSNLV